MTFCLGEAWSLPTLGPFSHSWGMYTRWSTRRGQGDICLGTDVWNTQETEIYFYKLQCQFDLSYYTILLLLQSASPPIASGNLWKQCSILMDCIRSHSCRGKMRKNSFFLCISSRVPVTSPLSGTRKITQSYSAFPEYLGLFSVRGQLDTENASTGKTKQQKAMWDIFGNPTVTSAGRSIKILGNFQITMYTFWYFSEINQV